MSFYGNISNASRTNLTFDKVYPNRTAMDNAATDDNVLIGRFVLVEYDDGSEPKRLDFFLKDGDASTINLSQENLENATAERKKLIEKARKQLENGFNLYYWIDKPEIESDNYEKNKIVSWTDPGELKENYRIEIGDVVRARLQLDNSYEPVYKENGDEKILVDYINPKPDQYSLFYFFEAIIDEKEEDSNAPGKPILFKFLGISNEAKGIYDDYTRNYLTDKETYKHLEWPNEGYDSTIWQKSVVNGEIKYLQIASLNSKMPVINIIPEAPGTGTVVQPFLDSKGTNELYHLHFPTAWGFKIKTLKRSERKDITAIKRDEYGNIVLDENGQPEKEFLDIYFNANGFTRESRHPSKKSEENFLILQGAKSGRKYSTSKGTLEELNDIQEMSISLPAIGNAVCEVYDVLYGVRDESGELLKERNLSYLWGNKDGVRATQMGPQGTIFNEGNLSSAAGVINSMQDLMGQIVEVSNDLIKANENTIYYVDYGKLTDEELKEKSESIGYSGPNFYRKTSKILYKPIENSEFKDYTIDKMGGRRYFKLEQFEPDTYYVKKGAKDREGNLVFNYYLDRKLSPDTSATYFHKDNLVASPIILQQWEPYIKDNEGNLPEALYYLNNWNYIQVNSEDKAQDQDYYRIIAKQVTYPNKFDSPDQIKTIFYNPEQYISPLNSKQHVYGDKTVFDENNNAIPDANGFIYYTGYFYLDEENNNKLVPVYDEPYRQNENYYLIKNYYIDKAQGGAEVGEVDAYYALVIQYEDMEDEEYGKETYVPLIKENIDKYIEQFNINLLEFIPGTYYIDKYNEDFNTTDYFVQNDRLKIEENIIYYSLEINQIIGEGLQPNPDNPEEMLDVKYYEPNKYFYFVQTTEDGQGNYLLDKREKFTEDTKYFSEVMIINEDENAISGTTFYAPNLYYYGDSQGIVRADMNERRSIPYTIDENGRRIIDRDYVAENYIYTDDHGNELAYFLPRTVHVIRDRLGVYDIGTLWDKDFEPPLEVGLGVRQYPLDDKNTADRFFTWELISGYAESFNTINGIILNAQKKFEFNNSLTREKSTAQGILNCLKDKLNDFSLLKDKEFITVDGYGRISSAKVVEDDWIKIDINPWEYEYDANGEVIVDTEIIVNEDGTNSELKWERRKPIPSVTVTHSNPIPENSIGTLGKNENTTLLFGDEFSLASFDYDEKGHIITNGKEVKLKLPSLSIEENNSGNILTGIEIESNGTFIINKNNIGNLLLTGYSLSEQPNTLTENDSINIAFGKLQAQLNILNDESSVEGSIRYLIEQSEKIKELEDRILALEEKINSN